MSITLLRWLFWQWAQMARSGALSLPQEGEQWKVAQIATVPDSATRLAGEVRLHTGDLDQQMAPFDLFAGSSTIVARLSNNLAASCRWKLSIADHIFERSQLLWGCRSQGDGRLDLLALSADGQPTDFVNKSTKGYQWQTIRPRARQTTGDQRVNHSVLVVRLRFVPGCWCKSRRSPAPRCILDSGLAPPSMWRESSGRMVLSVLSLHSSQTNPSSPSSDSKALAHSSLLLTARRCSL